MRCWHAPRRLRDRARENLEAGIDPAAQKQAEKVKAKVTEAMTFKAAALAWHGVRRHEWTPAYAVQVLNRLEEDIFPRLGERPVGEIKPKEMLEELKHVEARGVLETTRRLKQYCGANFRYAVASGQCEHDPTTALKGALKAPPRRS